MPTEPPPPPTKGQQLARQHAVQLAEQAVHDAVRNCGLDGAHTRSAVEEYDALLAKISALQDQERRHIRYCSPYADGGRIVAAFNGPVTLD